MFGNPKRKSNAKRTFRPRKEYDTLLDAWYFQETNSRHNKYVDFFRNYQINPYTKKTLDYVTPKVNERRPPLPDPCMECPDEEEEKLIASYKLVKRALDRSVQVPKCKFCWPETELMRLGWFPDPPPPVKARTCMFILPPWQDKPDCYYYPTPESDLQQNENYDERFRAIHQTAEFIKHDAALRKFDSIMNPNGYRGQVRTTRVLPGTKSEKLARKNKK